MVSFKHAFLKLFCQYKPLPVRCSQRKLSSYLLHVQMRSSCKFPAVKSCQTTGHKGIVQPFWIDPEEWKFDRITSHSPNSVPRSERQTKIYAYLKYNKWYLFFNHWMQIWSHMADPLLCSWCSFIPFFWPFSSYIL